MVSCSGETVREGAPVEREKRLASCSWMLSEDSDLRKLKRALGNLGRRPPPNPISHYKERLQYMDVKKVIGVDQHSKRQDKFGGEGERSKGTIKQ